MHRRVSWIDVHIVLPSSQLCKKRAKTEHLRSPQRGASQQPVAKDLKLRRRHKGSHPDLQWIYETAPVGLASLTPDCRYVQINQRFAEICGMSVADHIGRSVREVVPQAADQMERIVRGVTSTGEPVKAVEIRGQRADRPNSDRVWTTSWYPLKCPDGIIVGVNVVAEEMAGRRVAGTAPGEKVQSDSEARFRELADNISQFARTADQNGWIYWYNKRWHDYTGSTLEEMEGWGWQKVHHPDHVDRVVQCIRQSFETGTAWEDTFPLRARDGSYRWFLSRALPIRNDAGDIVRWFGTNTDITKQIDAERALRESEARFRELANNISQFAWLANEAGWIYWYNKRWHDYTGTTLLEMEGWGWQKVHHPEHVDRVVRSIRQSFETGTPWEDTFPLRGRDGSYRWFLSRALPIRNEAGEIVRWFGTNTDVTEQIEAEKALRELNETLELRVEAETRERLHVWNVSQDLLVVADLEGKYLSVNPAWTTTLGWLEDDLLGRTSEWLLHPDDQVKTRAEISHLAAGRKTVRFENRFHDKKGSYHWFSWKAVPDRGRIYALGRDITELKDAEDKLREARRELAQATRRTTLSAMSAAIAHEIKQPLAAIVANANAGLRWLTRTPPSLEEACDSFKDIAADGHRASKVIQSVRSMFSRTNQEGTAIDVNDLIRETVALMRADLEAASVVVQLGLASQIPSISGHRGQLQQVILNLVTNAAEAMRMVVERERILQIRSKPIGSNGLEVTVEDSGTGIELKDMDRIFDAFFTTRSNGMGIGLAICRSVVELMAERCRSRTPSLMAPPFA